MSFYNVIDNKVVTYCEIVCCLFEHCNLNCVFCPQDHNSIVGANEQDILSKADIVSDYIIANQRSTEFAIHIMGGELFQDKWIDLGFINIYQKFIDRINQRLPKEKEVIFNFVSNLLFTKTQTVFDFLLQNNLKLSVSYDPHGRFNLTQLDHFKTNIELFKKHIRMISCVMTKQNIQTVIEGDEYFDYLYSMYPVDWDSLLPSTGTKRDQIMMPKESETFEFYKCLVDRYPKCINIQAFTNKQQQNKMTCTRGNSLTVMPDGSIPEGCSGSVLLKEANTKDLGGTQIIENFMSKYNCFECEYFQRCPFTCFIKQDFKHIELDMDDCVFRQTFKYHDKKYS